MFCLNVNGAGKDNFLYLKVTITRGGTMKPYNKSHEDINKQKITKLVNNTKMSKNKSASKIQH